jgi:dTDP-4-dehydrorhamnose reductase
MKEVLVTGGSGLLGSTVATVIADQYDVTTTYLSNPVSFENTDCIEIDLTDEDQYDVLIDTDFDAIVHCAALTDVDRCEREPDIAYQHNVLMTEYLLDVADKLDSRFIHISTDAVFDGTEKLYTESHDPNPINVYGETKREAEKRVLSSDVDSVVVRTNIYGWNVTDSQSLAEWIINTLRKDETVPGFADAYFTPIYTGHLADCLLELIEQDFTGIIHIAGRERCSKYEFAKVVSEVFNYDNSLVTKGSMLDQDFNAARGKDLSLSVKRAEDKLGCDLPDVRTGLERMIQEER